MQKRNLTERLLKISVLWRKRSEKGPGGAAKLYKIKMNLTNFFLNFCTQKKGELCKQRKRGDMPVSD